MPKSTEQIPDNIDRLLVVLIIVILVVVMGAVWEFSQEPPSLRNIFDTVGILAALLGLGYSHYQSNRKYNQSEEQIEELRKTRLQPEYKERSRILDEAIEAAQKNINRLSGDGFTGNLDRVIELESLPANHQKYFEENHSDFVNSLSKYQKHENELNRLQSNTRMKLEDERQLEIFIDEHSNSDSDPTDWMIEQIITFSDVKWSDIEEKFEIERDSEKVPVQNSISETQRNSGSGNISP